MAEDLSYVDTIKYGLAPEQGRKKVEEINVGRGRNEDDRVSRLEDQVHKLQTTKPGATGSC